MNSVCVSSDVCDVMMIAPCVRISTGARWTATVASLTEQLDRLAGDVLVVSDHILINSLTQLV